MKVEYKYELIKYWSKEDNAFMLRCPDNSEVDLSIYDAIGNKLYESQALPSRNVASIEVRNLSNGLYIMVVTSTQARKSIKFNINH